ncbi:hypothetical protein H9P43_005901 [Blastocladiella emersonii ATCC 22665]|nr:hypothetical protein H9P43_005901 [Blastocladiella emersonii ATCC 22665]
MKPKSKKKAPATVRQPAARAAAASAPAATTATASASSTSTATATAVPAAPIVPPTNLVDYSVPPNMAQFMQELVRPALTCRVRHPAERVKYQPFRQTPPRDLTLHQNI